MKEERSNDKLISSLNRSRFERHYNGIGDMQRLSEEKPLKEETIIERKFEAFPYHS